ncbi:MAG: zinc ABC transporter substrate-binding protein [Anaerolineaceae bacterium]
MKKTILVVISLALVLAACASPSPTSQPGRLTVTVSILPQTYFVQKIAGDLVDVQALVGTGDDPHTYEPTSDQMRALTHSDLYFTIGVEFESAWMPRFSSANSDMQVVDSAAGVERIPIATDQNGELTEGGANAGELDPHIWFSPRIVKQISQNMADALIALDPANSAAYQLNLEEWLKEVDQVDADVRALLQNRTRDHFMVIHPAWGYFAEEYGLKMLAVETAGQEPGPEELAKLLDLAETYKVSCLFVQKGVNQKLARSIADQIGVAAVVELDPMAQDWPANMRFIAAKMAEALK